MLRFLARQLVKSASVRGVLIEQFAAQSVEQLKQQVLPLIAPMMKAVNDVLEQMKPAPTAPSPDQPSVVRRRRSSRRK